MNQIDAELTRFCQEVQNKDIKGFEIEYLEEVVEQGQQILDLYSDAIMHSDKPESQELNEILEKMKGISLNN